jgi:hypothetical protein
MIKTVDGRACQFIVDYFNGGVDIGNFKEIGVEIGVDEEYWEPIMGLYEVPSALLASDDAESTNTDAKEYFSKYWIDRDFYALIRDTTRTLKISDRDLENLLVPLSHTNFYKSAVGSSNMKEQAKEHNRLAEFLKSLSDPSIELESVRVRAGIPIDGTLTADKPEYEITDQASFKNRMFLSTLKELLKVASESDEFKQRVVNSESRRYLEYSPSKQKRENANTMMLIVYDYVLKNIADKQEEVWNGARTGNNWASMATGYLFETARLFRLTHELKHLISVAKKVRTLRSDSQTKEVAKKLSKGLLADIEKLNLKEELRLHEPALKLVDGPATSTRDNLDSILQQVEWILSDFSSVCDDSYLYQKVADAYRKRINYQLELSTKR